jgi:hypothetical protein
MMELEMVDADARVAGDVRPIPPRFWWLKRLSLAGLIFLVLLVGLRLWWGHHQWSKLQATVAAIAAKGEPIYFEDMRRPPIADQDNAAWYYQQALAQWPRVGPQNQLIAETDWYTYSPNTFGNPNPPPQRPPDPITDNEAYLDSLEPILDLVRQGSRAPDCDWGVTLQSPAINILLPHLGNSRKIAKQIDDAARRAHDVGRDALALELIALDLDLADDVNAPPPTLIGHLVAISIRAIATETIQDLGPTLDLGGGEDSPQRRSLRRIMATLLDDAKAAEELRQALIGERWSIYDTVLAILDGRMNLNLSSAPVSAAFRLQRAVIGPVFVADLHNMVTPFSDIIADEQALTHWPAFQARQALLSRDHPTWNGERDSDHGLIERVVSNLLMGSINFSCQTHFIRLARQRLAATALALRAYEVDHGERPATLDALIPDYLGAVPLDPLAAAGTPIGYVEAVTPEVDPTASRGSGRFATPDAVPVLYSVGPDGQDNGGLFMLDKEGRSESNRQNSGRPPGYDHVFPLAPLSPPVELPPESSSSPPSPRP